MLTPAGHRPTFSRHSIAHLGPLFPFRDQILSDLLSVLRRMTIRAPSDRRAGPHRAGGFANSEGATPMLNANEAKVLDRIGPDDRVLDVGGWARCFNRATHVIDSGPYETHGRHYQEHLNLAAQGGPVEHFTAETWFQRDICDHTPWPFPDKFFDFCICSHTLEDIRDPLWVCHEINRVAKRGYIEIPSLLFEMSRGREPGVPVGLCHHRWLIEVKGTDLAFSHKYHYIHGDRALSLPSWFSPTVPEERLVSYFFWDSDFTYREFSLSKEEMAAIVKQLHPGDDGHEATEYDTWGADRLKFEVTVLRQALEQAHHQNAALHREIHQLHEVGPTGIKVARRLHHLSRRYPRLSSMVRRITRVA